jgi:hypothetical protein
VLAVIQRSPENLAMTRLRDDIASDRIAGGAASPSFPASFGPDRKPPPARD